MSYITVRADRVISAVDVALDWIRLQRDHEQANMIQKAASGRDWFGFGKPWGYQKALDFLENGGAAGRFFDEYSAIQTMLYSKDVSELKALRRLAVETDGAVNVSDEMSYIFS